MSQDVVKVGVASAIGAAVFCVVVLVIAPVFTWYSAICGALVGGLVGYMGYEFRTVVSTVRSMGVKLFRKRTQEEQIRVKVVWLSFLIYCAWTLPSVFAVSVLIENPVWDLFVSVMLSSFFVMTIMLYGGGIQILEVVEEQKRPHTQDKRWVTPRHLEDFGKPHFPLYRVEHQMALYSRIRWVKPQNDVEDENWRQLDVYQLAPTLWNILRMKSVDLFLTMYLIVGNCFWLLSRIPSGFVRLAQWVGSLFRRIHSHQRVVCAESAIIGGMLTYTLMGDMSQTLSEKLFLVALGGISGFALGVSLWKAVLSWRASEVVPTAET